MNTRPIFEPAPLDYQADVVRRHAETDIWQQFQAERSALVAKWGAVRAELDADYLDLSAADFLKKHCK